MLYIKMYIKLCIKMCIKVYTKMQGISRDASGMTYAVVGEQVVVVDGRGGNANRQSEGR